MPASATAGALVSGPGDDASGPSGPSGPGGRGLGQEGRGSEEWSAGQRSTEERSTEERSAGERGTEERSTEERSAGERGTEETGFEDFNFEDFNLDDWPDIAVQDEPPAAKQPEPDPSSGSQFGQEARLTAWVRGRVQGVGFRWWIRRNALELGLRGFAENLIDGRVKVVAEGDRDGLAELLARLEAPGTPGHVAQVTHRWDKQRGEFTGFEER